MKRTMSAFFNVVLSSKVDKSTVMIETTRFQLKCWISQNNLNKLEILELLRKSIRILERKVFTVIISR